MKANRQALAADLTDAVAGVTFTPYLPAAPSKRKGGITWGRDAITPGELGGSFRETLAVVVWANYGAKGSELDAIEARVGEVLKALYTRAGTRIVSASYDDSEAGDGDLIEGRVVVSTRFLITDL